MTAVHASLKQVHYHLVPAPTRSPTDPLRSGWAAIIGRDELDDDEGEEIAKRIRVEVQKEVDRERSKRAKL